MATYYVSKSIANNYALGSDSNNGTSLATPFLTISKAITTAADGDTVYVNDGTYTDLELGASNVLSIGATKSLKMYPQNDYAVTLQSTAASAQIVTLTGTATNELIFGKFIIDGEIPGAPGTYQPTGVSLSNPSNQALVTLSGTRIQNCGTQHILNSKRRGTLKILDVQFAGLMAQGVASTASGADVASMITYVNGLTLSNVTTSTNALCRVLDFTRLSTSSQEYSLYVRNVNGTITAPASNGSSSTIAILVATGIGPATNLDGTANTPLIVEDCNVTYTASSTSATGYGVYIKNNASGATATAHQPIIRNNTFVANVPAGYVISAGDTTTAYDVNNPVIYGNTVTMPYYASSTPHGIAVGNVTGGAVYGNRINGGYVSIIAGINQGALITGNVSYGCYGKALYCKGSGATTRPTFSNNTIILTNTYGASRAGALGVAIQGATNNTDVLFQNNIVYALSDLYRYVEVDTSQAGTFVNNVYASAGPTGDANPWVYQSSNYANLAAWVAGHESDATATAPSFVSTTDYRLSASSSLLRAGKVLNPANSKDFRGRRVWSPPDMGAYQQSSGDPIARSAR